MNPRTFRTLSLALLGVAASAAQGQTYTWTGNGDGKSWTDASNWQNFNPPTLAGYGSSLVFNGDTDGILENNYSREFRLKNLSLLGRRYDLSGGALWFAGGGLLHTRGDFTNVRNDIVINTNSAATNTELEMRVDSGFTYVNGAISGNGGLRVTGSGGTILFGRNTYTGPTVVQGSTLLLGADQTLPGGDLQVIGGRMIFNAHTGDVRNLDLGDGNVANVGTVEGANPADPTSQGLMRLSGNVTFRGQANGGSNGAVIGVDTEMLAGSHLLGDSGNRSKSGTDELTFTGILSGAGSLVKTGDSTLTLTKASTYTGGTTIQAGRMNVLNLLGNYANDGTLSLSNNSNQTYGGTMSGKGAFIMDGTGTLTLNGALTHTGGTSVTKGTLLLTADGQLPSGGNLALNAPKDFNDNPTLRLKGTKQTFGDLQGRGALLGDDSNDTSSFSSDFFSSALSVESGYFISSRLRLGSLTKTGPGTLLLFTDPQETYIADVTLKGGSLITADTATPDDYNNAVFRSLNLSGGRLSLLANTGGLRFTRINLGDGQTSGFLGSIEGAFGAGRPTIGLGRYEGVISYNGAPGRTSDPVTLDTNIVFQSSGEPMVFSGNGNRSSGDVDVTITGDLGARFGGERVVKEGNSVYRLQGATLYQGGTTVNGGTLIVERPAGDYATNADLRLDTSVSGAIANVSGTGDLTKTGEGVLTVDGVLGNTGRTDILGGSLVAAGQGVYGGSFTLGKDADFANLSGGTVTFAKDARIDGFFTTARRSSTVFEGLVTGSGCFDGKGALEFRGGYSPGNSPAAVEIEGPVTFSSDLTMELAGNTLGTGYDHLTLVSLAKLGGGLNVRYYGGFSASAGQSFDLFDWDGGLSGRFSFVSLPTLGNGLAWDTSALYTSGVVSVQAVPEPAAFLALGLGPVGVLRRRRS